VNPNSEPLRIVAIGGGTGLSTLLQGLKALHALRSDSDKKRDNLDITAVVTVTDDGEVRDVARRDFEVLPRATSAIAWWPCRRMRRSSAGCFQYRFAGR
jgi:2-phospho-L-lactate transferase/gluconeogenesis factor (CofD/UPF0052 family)